MGTKVNREAKSVYLLWYTRGDDELLIGVYEKEAKARAAKCSVKLKPGLAEGIGEFEIAEYQLNQDHWRKDTRSSSA